MRTHWLMTAALLGAAACVPETHLQPQPNTRVLVSDKNAAVAEGTGVRVVADGREWHGHPSDLESRLTVVLVRVENHSGRPLRISTADFSLVGASQFRYSAIPPLALSNTAVAREGQPSGQQGTGGSGTAPNNGNSGMAPGPSTPNRAPSPNNQDMVPGAGNSGIDSNGGNSGSGVPYLYQQGSEPGADNTNLAPGTPQDTGGADAVKNVGAQKAYWGGYYGFGVGYGVGWGWGGWGPYYGWGSPYYGWGPGAYGYYPYGYYYSEPLPTRDMLNNAMPEGTLGNGGTTTGFLYFQGVGRREQAVNLETRLVDANTGEAFGTLSIPFQVRVTAQ